VVSNGKHAEVISVPAILCAKIPAGVSDDEAAFTVPGAIALQGIRLAQPTLGEAVVVIGLGLIGQLCAQLLRTHGCRVLGVDLAADKLALARSFGVEVANLHAGEDPVAAALAFSRGRGVDAVVVAAATDSNEPLHQAALMCRKRGRIVLVGVAGLGLSRADFYEKELSFQVSCSYGPGRYDTQYEEEGIDYPVGFVRWTAQRNFEAVLDMMAAKRLDTVPLISHRFPLAQAMEGYELLTRTDAPTLGILIEYPAPESGSTAAARAIELPGGAGRAAAVGRPRIAFIGAGNHAGRTLIPAFVASGACLSDIVSSAGVSAAYYGRKFGFARASTDTESLLGSADVDAVVIATRHDSHADLTVRALQAGKHVFVEKPLALTLEELEAIARAWESSGSEGHRPHVVVGFNRRFAPQAVRIKSLLAGVRVPKVLIATINAGSVPGNHWTRDRRVGGGRIVGEACHFVDLLRFLAGHRLVDAEIRVLGGAATACDDSSAITLRFADGSVGTIHYLSNGNRGFPKERLEVFCAGRVLQLDNFRRLRGYGWPGFRKLNLWRQDKGQRALVAAFVNAVRHGGAPPIAFDELMEVSRTVIAIGEGIRC
jgi:predicted dehydrogenase